MRSMLKVVERIITVHGSNRGDVETELVFDLFGQDNLVWILLALVYLDIEFRKLNDFLYFIQDISQREGPGSQETSC